MSKASRIEHLLDAVADVTRHSDRENLEISLARTLQELVNAPSVCIYRKAISCGEPGIFPVIRLWSGFDNSVEEVPGLEGEFHAEGLDEAIHKCVELGQALVCPDESGQPIRYLWPMYGVDQEVVGALDVQGLSLADSDLRLIQGFLRIHGNFISLLSRGERDALTGLLNRRTFDLNLTSILARQAEVAARERKHSRSIRKTPLSTQTPWICVLDIDHFKRVNDRFGHATGDEVLLIFSQVMREMFRNNDLLFRFGGEEFVLILEPTELEGAKEALERLRLRLAEQKIDRVGHVTASIGFSILKAEDTPVANVDRADQALYIAKRAGRNRVEQYEDLLAKGLIEPPSRED